MRKKLILTCAITGAADSTSKSDKVPVTPKEIAESAIEAAKAGASVAHIHVRDPESGKGARDPELFKEVVDRIRSSSTDIVINLTAGMGGDIEIGADEKFMDFRESKSDMVGPIERLAHIEKLLPEICTLDCGSLNFGDGRTIVVNTPEMLRIMAKRIQVLGVKPEMEIFDTGNLWNARKMVDEGLISDAPLFQLCLGIPYGAEATSKHMSTMIDNLPAKSEWAAFGISRHQMPMLAQACLLGGHCRVGLEDNLYLEKGILATNGQLVEKAIKIIELLGSGVMTPQETRDHLKLNKQLYPAEVNQL